MFVLCIAYVICYGFSCWALAHRCSVVQVRVKRRSTNHEHSWREAACTCPASLVVTARGFWEMLVNELRFCRLVDSDQFCVVNIF